MREFVAEIKRLIEDREALSKTALDQAVHSVLEKMSEAMSNLAADRVESGAAEQLRQKILKAQTSDLRGGPSDQSALLGRLHTDSRDFH